MSILSAPGFDCCFANFLITKEITVDAEQLSAHLRRRRYGSFRLTDAVRPALTFAPRQGFRHGLHHFKLHSVHLSVPVLVASVSAENLFGTFLELLHLLGDVVDIVLESSHQKPPRHFCRRAIDAQVLESYLWIHEDLLLNDGFTGMAVLPHIERQFEVQFDEHKLLVVYAPKTSDQKLVTGVLTRNGVLEDDAIHFIYEDPGHFHCSNLPHYLPQFASLGESLGVVETL